MLKPVVRETEVRSCYATVRLRETRVYSDSPNGSKIGKWNSDEFTLTLNPGTDTDELMRSLTVNLPFWAHIGHVDFMTETSLIQEGFARLANGGSLNILEFALHYQYQPALKSALNRLLDLFGFESNALEVLFRW